MQALSEQDWARIVLNVKEYTREARIQAAFHLENFTEEASLDALIQGLKTDPSPIVRHEFAFALGETAAIEKAGEALKEAVRNDPNIFVRHEAILALATLGKEKFIPFIEEYVNDPEIEMAESAQIALERIRGDFKLADA